MTCCIFHEEDGGENKTMDHCVVPFQAITLADTCMDIYLPQAKDYWSLTTERQAPEEKVLETLYSVG